MFGLNGCKDEDNPVQPGPEINSIEEQINSIRPIKRVYIYNYNGSGGNSLHGTPYIQDAFASRGFLIIIESDETLYYNLSRVISIKAYENEIRIQY